MRGLLVLLALALGLVAPLNSAAVPQDPLHISIGDVTGIEGDADETFFLSLNPNVLLLQTLTVTRTGSGTGTVTSDPAGIDCGAVCSADFDDGTVVTLTATAASGSRFAGWSGEGCSGTGTCQVTMDQARSVTATFVLLQTLTVTRTGSGTGTVTSDRAGINCG